jgi:hypothetical protein
MALIDSAALISPVVLNTSALTLRSTRFRTTHGKFFASVADASGVATTSHPL